MSNETNHPFAPDIASFARRLRAGDTSARSVTEVYLARIAQTNPTLQAYIYVDAEQALNTATAIDALLEAGVDLGPLMGVPVAVKDIFAVKGMPTSAGSHLDVTDCIGEEGPFIQQLRRYGCIILGKTRSIEFAAGAQNLIHPTPINPCDHTTPRTSGGSSHGSAVAVAAGLCAFAVGSDTGGSVRQPAALCGIVGLKTTHGLWSTQGVFPLCPTLDSVGLLAASTDDVAYLYSAIEGLEDIDEAPLSGLNLGVLEPEFLQLMDENVANCYEAALHRLQNRGVTLSVMNWPGEQERQEIQAIYAGMIPADLLTTLGAERLQTYRNDMDPVALKRLEGALHLSASDYIRLQRAQQRLAGLMQQRLKGLDALVSPSVPMVAPLLSEVTASVSAATDFIARSLSYTRPANVYNLCALTLPIHNPLSELPVGLHLACKPHHEKRLISIAKAMARHLSTSSLCKNLTRG